jgi:hypothetical protein
MTFGDAAFNHGAPEIIERNMREDRIGLRTGKGFYGFAGVDVAAYRKGVLQRLVRQLAHVELLPPPGAALKRGAPAEDENDGGDRAAGNIRA